MLSITDPGGGLAPCPAPFNLAAYVLGRASAQPDKIALQVVGPARAERWSYGRLEGAVRGVARGLADRGIEPGGRVLLRIGNRVEFPLAFLGAIAGGFIPVPTPAQLTVPEFQKLVTRIRPAAVIAGDGLALPEGLPCPVIDEAGLRAMEEMPPAPYVTGDPDRAAYIVFTSGSSGTPRAVVHAHRAVWARRMMWSGWYDLGPEDRLLHAGAFNWTFTLGTGLLDPWAAGATALVPAEGVTPDQLPLLLKRHDVTIFAAAPGIYRQMLRSSPQLRLPKLRHGLTAGERLAEPLRGAWTGATGLGLHEAFGMSECSTFVSGSPTRPAPAGFTGYAQPGRRVALLDAEGTPVPRGSPGTLAVHQSDPGLFLGYFEEEGETKSRYQGDWFLTGDIGEMAEDGAIRYLGRDDDMMNAGGFRVSPMEVEAALNAHPDVQESAAVEVRVRDDVSVIAAFYTGSATPEDLAAYAATCLARYKQPRIFRHTNQLPRGGNGKLNRRKLREDWIPET